MSRPLKIACSVLVSFLAVALMAVMASFIFGREAVANLSESVVIILGVIVLPVLLGGLLVGLLHRGIKSRIEGPAQNRDHPDQNN